VSEECQRCEICVEHCPIMEIDDSFKIFDVFFEDEPEIWKCCSCFLCESVCPYNLSVRDALFEKRRLKPLINLPKRIQKYHENILEQGFAFPIDDLNQERLKRMDLPEINLSKIRTSIKKILSHLNEEGD